MPKELEIFQETLATELTTRQYDILRGPMFSGVESTNPLDAHPNVVLHARRTINHKLELDPGFKPDTAIQVK